VVLEGHARLTAFLLCPDRLPPELEVLVGASPAMTRWRLWQSPAVALAVGSGTAISGRSRSWTPPRSPRSGTRRSASLGSSYG
jgi:hypothetical protein